MSFLPRRAAAPHDEGPAPPSTPLAVVADEEAWVGRIRAGDKRAFDALFAAYYARLCEFVAGYVRSDAVAEECVQDVLFRVWAERERWHVRGSVRQYLFGAARNHALNVRKHHRVVERWAIRAEHDRAAQGLGVGPAAPDAGLRAAEIAVAVQSAIARLPARRREVYCLRWRDQLSHAEIAAVLGITVKSVETHLGRALEALRRDLAAWYDGRSAIRGAR
jgi:RNA polymerase sigma-70 factor (ECF subfamily)